MVWAEELADNKVVHIGEDVTVRYFTPKPASHRVPVEPYEVIRMGEDVTVRYLTPGRSKYQKLIPN